MILCMDAKTVQAFEDLEPSVKAAFTREYNKQHKDDFTGKKVPKGTKGAAKKESVEDDEDETEDKPLMDEEHLQEIKKAKKMDKLQEESKQVDKSEKFEMLQI